MQRDQTLYRLAQEKLKNIFLEWTGRIKRGEYRVTTAGNAGCSVRTAHVNNSHIGIAICGLMQHRLVVGL